MVAAMRGIAPKRPEDVNINIYKPLLTCSNTNMIQVVNSFVDYPYIWNWLLTAVRKDKH